VIDSTRFGPMMSTNGDTERALTWTSNMLSTHAIAVPSRRGPYATGVQA
jgi:hypothetical protein